MVQKIIGCSILVAAVLGTPARAGPCDVLVAQLHTAVPELELTGTKHMAGAPDFDVAFMKHPHASAIALTCGPQQPSVSVDWRGSPPPTGYFELVGQLGSIVTGATPPVIRTGALECQKRAQAAAYEMSGYQLAGVRFECAIFTHEGGGLSMMIHG
jgi:hypothetical protein